MQAIIQKVALQAALIGSMSVGSYVIRKISKPIFHEYIQNTTYLKHNQDLSSVLNDISFLKNDELFKVIINEVSSDYFSSTYHAPRPYCERLINYKLNLINMNIMRDWEICLKEYLINSFNEIN